MLAEKADLGKSGIGEGQLSGSYPEGQALASCGHWSVTVLEGHLSHLASESQLEATSSDNSRSRY